ncbi:NAD-dependent epimerase/dehydratase family protein [Rhizobium sp.]|jgi:D-erythronate 2-dehydrogenase|uniref:NAD-dependent epimerase/dehydratase family protein n=1 Tax=Rhizobium sp. TaxID=391 RepID=UPI000E9CA911|nr:UDP-glucose 4-epimerase [Rhizobium sp.]
MRILVTGADGFLGRSLAARLAAQWSGLEHLVLSDRQFATETIAGADYATGDLGDAAFLDHLLQPGFDLVFHLASVPGGLAEQQQELGYRANLLAPLEFARKVSAGNRHARFVFASSIAVYGDVGSGVVTDRTGTRPLLTYGAHKLMTEMFLSDMTRRGELSAVNLRFPGLVARPPSESGHGSAFMSLIFHKIAAGEAYACPVPATATCWWMSRSAAVDVLLHAARLEQSSLATIQPPVLHATVSDVSRAVEHLTGKTAQIDWGDDQNLTRIFGAMPGLDAASALELGFKADANLDALAIAPLSGGLS